MKKQGFCENLLWRGCNFRDYNSLNCFWGEMIQKNENAISMKFRAS